MMALKSEGDSRNKKADAPKAESKKVTPRYINGELVPQTQPLLVTGGVLRSYQVEGLEWLKGREILFNVKLGSLYMTQGSV